MTGAVRNSVLELQLPYNMLSSRRSDPGRPPGLRRYTRIMAFRLLTLIILCSAAMSQNRDIQRAMRERVQQEAGKFAQAAPQLQTTETLEQTRLDEKKAARPHKPKDPWPPLIHRKVISRYGFVAIPGQSLQEVRQVISVDGKEAKQSVGSLNELILSLSAADDAQRRRLLETFEKHGLRGVATDCSPMILLFAPDSIQRFEFAFQRTDKIGETPSTVYKYYQIDGPGTATIFAQGQAIHPKLEGELWVRTADQLPMRVTMASEHEEKGSKLHDVIAVDYGWANFGTLLPVHVIHRQILGQSLVVEDDYRYDNWETLK
jgi:hypothetical protein